jgi:hypothetical protein
MLIGAPLTSPPYGSWEALLALALVVALIGGFLAAVGGGFVGGEVEDKLVPNQGIRRSARRALVVGSAAGFGGAVIGLAAMSAVIGVFAVVGSMTGVAMSRPGWIEDTALPLAVGGAILGVVVSAAVAPGLALSMGGYACLSHAALRGVLWRSDCLALDSVSFLDYATQRVFLRKVGGGYMFVHRMLQEHFAAQHPA